MFAYRKRARAWQLRVRLITGDGQQVGPADPWGLLPMEFFRVVSTLERIFFTEQDHAAREEFCREVLARLNDRPWRGWDEVKAALAPPAGQRFAAMELYLVEVDFDQCDPSDRTYVVSAELLHRHDPSAVAAELPQPQWRFVAECDPSPQPQYQEN
ncbi:hypothetical protein ACFQ2M_19345 [Kitasatospora saccharophila]